MRSRPRRRLGAPLAPTTYFGTLLRGNLSRAQVGSRPGCSRWNVGSAAMTAALVRGTGHGTAGREIPVQSVPLLRSAVVSVQARQRVRESSLLPAESAKPPTTIRQSIPATSPDDVAKVTAGPARATPPWDSTCGWSWSPACAGASCAACRSATSTSTASPETVTDLAEPRPELQNGRVYSAGFFEDRWRRYPHPSLSRGFGSSRS